MKKKMRIGLKVGSKVLTDGNGGIREKVIKSICYQLTTLKKEGHEVFLVTSGAVACDPNTDRPRSVRAAIGQGELFFLYRQYLAEWGIKPAQFLFTDRDLHSPHDRETKENLQTASRDPIILPIINANDPVDGSEIRALQECADNDIIFTKVCFLTKVDMAVIGFWKEGVYNSTGGIIPVATLDRKEELLSYVQGGSDVGYGENGMVTKVKCSFDLVENGTYVVLVPGYRSNFLIKAVNKTPEFGTVFY